MRLRSRHRRHGHPILPNCVTPVFSTGAAPSVRVKSCARTVLSGPQPISPDISGCAPKTWMPRNCWSKEIRPSSAADQSKSANSPATEFQITLLPNLGSSMTVIYGIKNCDTMHKARAWLDSHKVAYEFHDYKASSIDKAKLEGWVDKLGWETVLNRAGTTFKKLPDADKANLTAKKAVALMLAQ